MEYTVAAGDTLTSIAAANPGTTPQSIAEANGITNINEIQVGQIITIPDPAPDAEIPGEEPGVVPGEDLDETDALLEQLGQVKEAPGDATEPVEDYSSGKFTGPGINVSLEGKGDLDTKERDFFGDMVEETKPGTFSVDITKGDGGPSSEAEQFAQGGKQKIPGVTEEMELQPTEEEEEKAEEELTGEEDAAIPPLKPPTTTKLTTDTTAKEIPGVKGPLTRDDILKIIQENKPNFQPTSDTIAPQAAVDTYDKVIQNIGEIDHSDKTVDGVKEFYREISEEAAREVKKLDTSIAEIAEEKMKPTFSGWNKVMAVLGAAMGAYGSAMTGSKNFALDIINRAMDEDAKQFLASKEIRTQSLLKQRQELLQRRADLLQIAINESDRMLKVAELQIEKEESVANVQAVKDGLMQQQQEIMADYYANIADLLTKKIAANATKEAALSKDQRERSVKAIELIDENGNTVSLPSYLAQTEDEAKKHRESWLQTKSISEILNDIDKIAGTPGAFLPDSISNTKTSLANKSSQLIVHLKELYGMGANFTQFEQALVRQQTPTDGVLEQFKVWQQKSKDLRRQLIMKHKARSGSQGAKFTQMPNAGKQKPLAKGQQAAFKTK